jgi:hypothetical protein
MVWYSKWQSCDRAGFGPCGHNLFDGYRRTSLTVERERELVVKKSMLSSVGHPAVTVP